MHFLFFVLGSRGNASSKKCFTSSLSYLFYKPESKAALIFSTKNESSLQGANLLISFVSIGNTRPAVAICSADINVVAWYTLKKKIGCLLLLLCHRNSFWDSLLVCFLKLVFHRISSLAKQQREISTTGAFSRAACWRMRHWVHGPLLCMVKWWVTKL